MSNYDKVKIVIVGDSGVGKTSVVHLLCQNKPLSNPAWTVGVGLEVKLHEFRAGTPDQKTYFIDFWDVGGSSSHQNTRGVFYNGVNGIILVHDLTNRKSEGNLSKWLAEILNRETSGSGRHNNFNMTSSPFKETDDFDPEQFAGSSHIPILVIGTKVDSLEGNRPPTSRANSIAEECRAEEIFISCLDPKSISPGSTAAVKLSRFLDVVIEYRFHRDSGTNLYDRKRIYPQSQGLFTNNFY